ncbi:electron transfer flavoprotein subunit alpha/FixB family protein [Marinobacter sp. NP-6]|uniref:electron transfer flavoprotein subunit alpha/FixB family protein n=1 Tax=Marinobacter sp. NP-6 TaxID=2488666 RepID=UPI000FCC43DF|nr:FAD-binding protein [Marinobacter sp. NP-6]RUT76952.1 electron transfer flavoprotein subunit alpha/FixB family protein [Marinobacter sp. NP-6]
MSILVIAEHDNAELNGATLSALAAAKEIGAEHVSVLVAGDGCGSVAEQAAQCDGVDKVVVCDNAVYKHQLPENIADLVVQLSNGASHVLVSATTWGKSLMPRIAALLDVDQVSEIISVLDEQTFKRPIYAGNAIATVKSSAALKAITVRATSFDPVSLKEDKAVIESNDLVVANSGSQFLDEKLTTSDRPDLTTAEIVISGGRGMQSGDNFKLLYDLADKLGAAVGASRAAVDAGFVSNDLQVGQTGKIVAPKLYVAVGISGAIQHLAGMSDSKVIVAINKDEEAPIFQVADYGLVADLFEAVPEFDSKL